MRIVWSLTIGGLFAASIAYSYAGERPEAVAAYLVGLMMWATAPEVNTDHGPYPDKRSRRLATGTATR